jgi:hypothetical protein
MKQLLKLISQPHLLRGFGFLGALTLAVALAVTLPDEGQVLGDSGSKPTPGKTRVYYIAADEVEWDYAPSGENQITGEPFDEDAKVFVERGEDRIGKVYLKALLREYSEAKRP